MGKPRLIIIIRHAQSEGNQNRQIHQTVPDHRVKLTPEGWEQAYDAGRRLRSMLLPSDTLQFYVSPYRRTRETTQAILDTLTSDTPEPSPFSKSVVKVWEEPRLREQDFGNFQPSAADMERMWQERADYGHFFYRIPNGESAADAYDRVSGFNESLWRSFGEEDFPSVCVLVTHGLMTRVFLMKWYHWSVEYFEDLRNVNHCEFVVMTRSIDSGKFLLQNQLRTWSELKRRAAAAERGEDPASITSPTVPARKRWGGFPEDGSGGQPTGGKRRDTKDFIASSSSKPATPSVAADKSSLPAVPREAEHEPKQAFTADEAEDDEEAFPNPDDEDAERTKLDLHPIKSNTAAAFTERMKFNDRLRTFPSYLEAGRDFGGTTSGAASPTPEADTERQDYVTSHPSEPQSSISKQKLKQSRDGNSDDDGETTAEASSHNPDQDEEARWVKESGMGSGARADALGDQNADNDEGANASATVAELEARDKSIRGSVY